MKKLPAIVAALAVAFLVGCASQSRTTYNTLASVQSVTTAAYNSYLDLVIQKQLPTNSVPKVSQDYNLFQLTWSAAVLVAQWNTNAPATDSVIAAGTQVVNDINAAKKGTP